MMASEINLGVRVIHYANWWLGGILYFVLSVKREFYFRRMLSKLITWEEMASVRVVQGFYQGFNCFSEFLPLSSQNLSTEIKLDAIAFSDIKILGKYRNSQNRKDEIELSLDLQQNLHQLLATLIHNWSDVHNLAPTLVSQTIINRQIKCIKNNTVVTVYNLIIKLIICIICIYSTVIIIQQPSQIRQEAAVERITPRVWKFLRLMWLYTV